MYLPFPDKSRHRPRSQSSHTGSARGGADAKKDEGDTKSEKGDGSADKKPERKVKHFRFIISV